MESMEFQGGKRESFYFSGQKNKISMLSLFSLVKLLLS